MKSRFVRHFDSIELEDLDQVGGKNASLGEMTRSLKPYGIQVPEGFAITMDAFQEFIRVNRFEPIIHDLMMGLNVSDLVQLQDRSKKIRSLIHSGTLTDALLSEIERAYESLAGGIGRTVPVAVRSSALSEDLPTASFAGQLESFLNIEGMSPLRQSILDCYASLYSERAISYRIEKKIDESRMGLSVGIQKMVRSDLGVSGVMFTLDPETGFDQAIVINSSYGLGESVVKGVVNPDEYVIHKTKLNEGYAPFLRKFCGAKETKVILGSGPEQPIKTVPVADGLRSQFSLNQREILQLARWGVTIENHYEKKFAKRMAMDIEWAKDGLTGELFILQARPETVYSSKSAKNKLIIAHDRLKTRPNPILSGKSVGQKIVSGRARVIHALDELSLLKEGEILVADKTDPDWEPIMKTASAIVTNRGGRTCHAAIIARELGVPAIVGCLAATRLIEDGQTITVEASLGSDGYIYEGSVPFSHEEIDLSKLKPIKQDLKLILGNPDEAFRFSHYPQKGVGLLRLEFMISSQIRIHPMAIVKVLSIRDPEVLEKIRSLTVAYSDPEEFFIEKLAEGMAMMAGAFYPNEVIVRMSDFKSNEYSGLIGGNLFERSEENPMIGFRGASRYTHPFYREAFELECKAVLRARTKMGFQNLHILIPFCRTPEEGKRVVELMDHQGLKQGKDGLKILVMAEIPSNVLLADRFCEVFDGFSIGSNDLTQLVLGVDRDSELLSGLFDEKNPAVTKMISDLIRMAHSHGKTVGICGQAPSDDPEFLEFLLREKIDSISLNADSFLNVYSQLGRS